jgi:diguanylate cyclase (GGDEF)-like protein
MEKILWLLYLTPAIPLGAELLRSGGIPATLGDAAAGITGAVVTALLAHLAYVSARAARSLTVYDPLTGLFNRQRFDIEYPAEVLRAERQGQALTLATVDIDRFRAINEQFGHDEGDRVLLRLSQALRRLVRAEVDRCYRIGWDQFCILMPGATDAEAAAIIERIWHAAHGEEVGLDRLGGGLSIGVVNLRQGEAPPALLRRAEQIMFEVKRRRKAQLPVSPPADSGA